MVVVFRQEKLVFLLKRLSVTIWARHLYKNNINSKNQPIYMKSDINNLPIVENVFLAAVQEWSDDFLENIWNIYLINDSDFQLDGVMLVSKASEPLMAK